MNEASERVDFIDFYEETFPEDKRGMEIVCPSCGKQFVEFNMIEVLDRKKMIIRCDACRATLRVDTDKGEFVEVKG